MLFNTLEFALFYPLVFVLYWFVTRRSLRLQNIMLLVASYYFYGRWDWRFMFLLIFSTFLDYFSGLQIHRAGTRAAKRAWLIASVGINLGFLGCFKYYNFFASSFADMVGAFGFESDPIFLTVILPVGISFYTFHGLSYVFDIYYDRIKPTTDPVDYALFVGFFPLLVAGPIERATHLLPQIQRPRQFDVARAVDGCRQVLWGVFKKVVIADNAAEVVNSIFEGSATASGSTLLFGAVLFAFQIYGDFSGYSDIALGTARLLGIELLQNFSFPYFSRDIAEFWRRWHISLSSWFRDYVYIPLGGSRGGTWMKVRNTSIIFLVSGFWHGANWTFVAWGALHALFFLPLLLSGTNRSNMSIVAQNRMLPNLRELMGMVTTFLCVVLAWVFFRAEDLHHATGYLGGIFSSSLFSAPVGIPLQLLMLIGFFLLIEWGGRHGTYGLQVIGLSWPRPLRWVLYYGVLFLVFRFTGRSEEFIYFQF
ncbi:MAG TPA: MBOAT family O-acyltransferase [Flavobacteriales bacterium]|nr:MBOAT family O-acyltransferase [Flavobacteriales bacterium]